MNKSKLDNLEPNQENQTAHSEFYHKLRGILDAEQILCDEPMSRHTTFRVGGPADYFLTPRLEQAADVLALCRQQQVPYHIVGNGSNLLVGDLGIRGAVIAFTVPAAQIRVQPWQQEQAQQPEQYLLTAGAGALLSQAAAAAYRAGLGGLEFAAGIPGSVGGAVVMNAGAYGGEIKDVLLQARVLTQEGQILTLSRGQLAFSYRHSCIPEKHMVVLEAEFILQQKPKEEIAALMDELKKRRVEKQPLEYPSAGSTFKRPEGYFAGKLIMDTGLAGYQTGGAQVSAKHCGFVINTGNATAADIRQLISDVQQKVQEKFHVSLEMEVKCMGEFGV